MSLWRNIQEAKIYDSNTNMRNIYFFIQTNNMLNKEVDMILHILLLLNFLILLINLRIRISVSRYSFTQCNNTFSNKKI